LVDQRSEDQVNMIRHDHSRVKKMLGVAVVKTASQSDRSRHVRQNPPLERTKCNKVPLVVALQMRQFSAVEHNSRSDSRLGCPAKAKPSGLVTSLDSLEWSVIEESLG